ncbi:unnamed protein product [Calicophoron daubneyi]|uniref:Uncharacterized protein n=1 Tax=Calicophoron daubneyi TaxID=300641 RepID=A0AAV2TDG7_CALDB
MFTWNKEDACGSHALANTGRQPGDPRPILYISRREASQVIKLIGIPQNGYLVLLLLRSPLHGSHTLDVIFANTISEHAYWKREANTNEAPFCFEEYCHT